MNRKYYHVIFTVASYFACYYAISQHTFLGIQSSIFTSQKESLPNTYARSGACSPINFAQEILLGWEYKKLIFKTSISHLSDRRLTYLYDNKNRNSLYFKSVQKFYRAYAFIQVGTILRKTKHWSHTLNIGHGICVMQGPRLNAYPNFQNYKIVVNTKNLKYDSMLWNEKFAVKIEYNAKRKFKNCYLQFNTNLMIKINNKKTRYYEYPEESSGRFYRNYTDARSFLCAGMGIGLFYFLNPNDKD